VADQVIGKNICNKKYHTSEDVEQIELEDLQQVDKPDIACIRFGDKQKNHAYKGHIGHDPWHHHQFRIGNGKIKAQKINQKDRTYDQQNISQKHQVIGKNDFL